jgi:glyoxylase-like metal-dependent hydrolase (beta-lactamase superfamily II)
MNKYIANLGPYLTNCYILDDEKSGECAVFDVGGYNKSRINKWLSNVDESKIKYIFLTHRHYDHVAGVEELRLRTGAKVIIGEKDKEGLYDEVASLAVDFARPLNKCKDFETVKEGDTFYLGDKKIEVIETPGHTVGSVTYLVDDFMMCGDFIFFGSIGRTDLATGNMADMKKSISKIKKLDKDYIICNGHGDETTLNYEKTHNPFFKF